MKAIITIQMDNAAFDQEEGNGFELARILRKAADYAEGYANLKVGVETTFRDSNGNTVGRLQVKA